MTSSHNKTALVTGSSKGIGFAIAKALHKAGYNTVLNGRDAAKLADAVQSIAGDRCGMAVGDVSDPLQAKDVLKSTLDQFGSLDLLVCNVGSGASVPPGQEHFAEWQRVFATNLWSATNMVEASKDSLLHSKGSIICISSICGTEVIPGAPVTYSAAKSALNAFVQGIARPLGKDGVRINAIAPGNILFETSVWQRKLDENADAVADMLDRDVSLGKLGTPEDIANLVLWLASDQASFASGQIWTLDGGQTRS